MCACNWRRGAAPRDGRMKTYPRLSEMGVANPQHIAGFSVNSIDYSDYLRITYDRPKGSLLAFSRTYKFPRVQTTAKAAGPSKGGVVMQSSPAFREAVGELQNIVEARRSTRDNAQTMLDELHQLEEDVAMRCAKLKALIDEAGTE